MAIFLILSLGWMVSIDRIVGFITWLYGYNA